MKSVSGTQIFSALSALAAIAFLYMYLTWHNGFADLLSDSAIYLLMASVLDSGQQIPRQVFDIVMSDYHFPPLFPLTLWLFGGGAEYPLASHLINTALVVAGFVSFFAWLRVLETDWYRALVLVCIFAILPSVAFFANYIVSEFLYLSLALLGFAALERSRGSAGLLYASALLFGLAIATRTIGIALLPALALVAFRAQRKHFIFVLAVAVCPYLLWSVYKTSYESSNYVSSFFLSHKGDFTTSLAVYARVNVQVLGLSWIKSFDHFISDYSTIPAAILGLLVFVGWLLRIARLKADAIYVLFYILILVPWPHPDHIHRFLLPLLPMLLYYGLTASATMAGRIGNGAPVLLLQSAYFALLLALTIPTNVNLVQRLTSPVPAHLSDFGRSHFWLFSRDPGAAIQRMEFLHSLHVSIAESSSIPSDACVWSIDPARHMLLSKRVSYGTPSPALDAAAFTQASGKCQYFFTMRVVPRPNQTGVTPLYPIERIENDTEVVQEFAHEKFGVISMLLVRTSDDKLPQHM